MRGRFRRLGRYPHPGRARRDRALARGAERTAQRAGLNPASNPDPAAGRAVTADVRFSGWRIPAGANLTILPYALHRHPAHREETERFDPSRFSPRHSEGRHACSCLPLAAGPRTCIGAGMAMLEIEPVLLRLLSRFRVRPVPGHPVVPRALVTYRPRFGLKATATPRD